MVIYRKELGPFHVREDLKEHPRYLVYRHEALSMSMVAFMIRKRRLSLIKEKSVSEQADVACKLNVTWKET